MIDGLARWTGRRDLISAAVLGNAIVLRASTGRVLTFAVVAGHDATFTVNHTLFCDGQLEFYLVVRPSMAIAAAWNVMIFMIYIFRCLVGCVRKLGVYDLNNSFREIWLLIYSTTPSFLSLRLLKVYTPPSAWSFVFFDDYYAEDHLIQIAATLGFAALCAAAYGTWFLMNHSKYHASLLRHKSYIKEKYRECVATYAVKIVCLLQGDLDIFSILTRLYA